MGGKRQRRRRRGLREERAGTRQCIGGRCPGTGVAVASQVVGPSGVQRDDMRFGLSTPCRAQRPADPSSRGPTTLDTPEREGDDGPTDATSSILSSEFRFWISWLVTTEGQLERHLTRAKFSIRTYLTSL